MCSRQPQQFRDAKIHPSFMIVPFDDATDLKYQENLSFVLYRAVALSHKANSASQAYSDAIIIPPNDDDNGSPCKLVAADSEKIDFGQLIEKVDLLQRTTGAPSVVNVVEYAGAHYIVTNSSPAGDLINDLLVGNVADSFLGYIEEDGSVIPKEEDPSRNKKILAALRADTEIKKEECSYVRVYAQGEAQRYLASLGINISLRDKT